MRLLNRNILVRMNKKENTSSGIIMLEDSTISTNICTVVSIADDVYELNVGDKLIIPKLVARRVVINNEELALITIDDVMIILDRDDVAE